MDGAFFAGVNLETEESFQIFVVGPVGRGHAIDPCFHDSAFRFYRDTIPVFVVDGLASVFVCVQPQGIVPPTA